MLGTIRRSGFLLALATGTQLVGFSTATVDAAEVAVLSASAVKPVLQQLADAFQRNTGHSVKLTFATAGEVEKRITAGDPADVVILTDLSSDKLAADGLISPDTRAIIARAGVGIGVREGAAKPDIATPDALKQTLMAARSVAFPDPARGGASGIHFAKVIEQLGIADPIRQKSVLGADPDIVCIAVAKGEAELCVHQISEILPVKGVALLGPLPRQLQRVTTFAVALSPRASAHEAARDFLAFVTHPSFKASFAEAGLDYSQD